MRIVWRMGSWGQWLVERYPAVERRHGAGLPLTRVQRWVGRHPVWFCLCIAIPVSFGGALFAREAGGVVVALIFGPALGAVYSVLVIGDRTVRGRLRWHMGFRDEG